ncbi:Cyclin PHO80-like [Trypanosoma melophagium]|uniref:Cyclin PHO80-like n=1 Tax=Trypanosoma melophagium TaxID=715481 RepID=UPI00351AADFF|nr:Cyclin PHO80-like [Trypanosoma melophagium]
MSARTRSRTPAQVQMATIITMYIQHIMELQAGLREESVEVKVAPPTESFPSFDFFCAEFVPGISVEKYVQRLVTYMRCSPEAYIFALAYIRHLFICGFPLHSRSIHRVLLTAVVVAAKTRDDLYCSMSYYSQVGGVSKHDLNMMELRFLVDLIDFKAEVHPDEYRSVCNDITAVNSIKKNCCSTSDVCDVTASNSPSELDETVLNSKPQWMTECQLYW